MKIFRSTKVALKFSTKAKRERLRFIMDEYSKVVNFFIEHFKGDVPKKSKLLKPIVDLPKSWLSFSMRQTAAREAVDMLHSRRKAGRVGVPTHNGKIMYLSSGQIAFREKRKAKSFDCWLHFRNIGRGFIFDIPIKLHDHYHALSERGRRMESFVIGPDSIQLSFKIETGKKKKKGVQLGIDTGIKTLATTSKGKKLGTDTERLVEKIKRKKYGSKKQSRARKELRHYMDATAKELLSKARLQLVVVEDLKKLGYKSRLKRRLSKNMRCSLGAWNYRYWLNRVQMASEDNRVVFRSVSPAYTSQRCHDCGHTERGNRTNQEMFRCKGCGYACNADVNAARNILERFLSGPYGAACKIKSAVRRDIPFRKR